MKILVVSDIESKFIWDYFDPERFRDVKMIISCGDLSARYLSFLVTMIPCPLFYVPGNHDKKYEREPPEGCVNIDGRVIEYKGVRMMGLGGCKSPHPCLYEYSVEQMWRRVKRLEPQIRRSKGIDLFITHAPALGLGDGPDLFHEGFQSFRYIDDVYKPAIHFYGHRHLGENPMDRRAIYPYNESVMINACGYKIPAYPWTRLPAPIPWWICQLPCRPAAFPLPVFVPNKLLFTNVFLAEKIRQNPQTHLCGIALLSVPVFLSLGRISANIASFPWQNEGIW